MDSCVGQDALGRRSLFPPRIIIALVVTAIAFTLLLGAVWRSTGGTFGFSLDDPYIHLALAERICNSHYGLNPNEPASPASSIVFPFLVAAALKFGVGQQAVLVINALATGAIVVLLGKIAIEARVDLAQGGVARLCLLTAAILLGFNLVGVAFTGLEHSLHIADTLACLYGMIRTVKSGRMPNWLPCVLVLNPLLRFEGLSIWGAGIIVLVLEKQRVGALVTLLAGLLLVGGFCGYLHHLGLPWLPSSVLVKSQSVGSKSALGALAGVTRTFLANLKEPGATQLLIALLFLTMRLGDRSFRHIALFAGLPTLAHLVAGRFGWFGRYELYIIALAWAAVLMLYGKAFEGWSNLSWFRLLAGIALCLLIQSRYVYTTLMTPRAAAEIHLQQFQMHRFAIDFWRGPVAVNDLGWVAYGNPNYVLDLYGLGSEVARVQRIRYGDDPSWMEQLVREHHVDVAMIYPQWFDAIPPEWSVVATLTLEQPTIVAAFPQVSIYATNSAAKPRLREALSRFAATLPRGVTLTLR